MFFPPCNVFFLGTRLLGEVARKEKRRKKSNECFLLLLREGVALSSMLILCPPPPPPPPPSMAIEAWKKGKKGKKSHKHKKNILTFFVAYFFHDFSPAQTHICCQRKVSLLLCFYKCKFDLHRKSCILYKFPPSSFWQAVNKSKVAKLMVMQKWQTEKKEGSTTVNFPGYPHPLPFSISFVGRQGEDGKTRRFGKRERDREGRGGEEGRGKLPSESENWRDLSATPLNHSLLLLPWRVAAGWVGETFRPEGRKRF